VADHALDDARAKLQRARQHLANLKRKATKLGRDTDRHRIFVDYDPDEGHYVVYSKTRPEPLPNLSLILGDLIHCARGALDFTAWQLANEPVGEIPTDKEAKKITFPITRRRTDFDSSAILGFVPKDVACEMLRHQPHPGSDPGNDNLIVLQWISNRDKHRLVVPLFAFIDPPPLPKYTFTPPLPAGTEESRSLLVGPETDDPAEIFYKDDPTTVRFGNLTLTPRPPDTHVEIDPQPPLDVLFGGPVGYVSMPDVKAIIDRVEFIVGRFERFLWPFRG
jgi:hypothetical protein